MFAIGPAYETHSFIQVSATHRDGNVIDTFMDELISV